MSSTYTKIKLHCTTEMLYTCSMSGPNVCRPTGTLEFLPGLCLCIYFDFIFLSQCYSLTTHESGDGRTVGGVSVKSRVTKIDN